MVIMLNTMLTMDPATWHQHSLPDGRRIAHSHQWGDMEHVHDSGQFMMFGVGWEEAQWTTTVDPKPPSSRA